MTRRIIFERTYNHRWPSRAITEYQASPTPQMVKKEVREAALAGGYARPATSAECAAPDRADDSAAMDPVSEGGGRP